MPCLHLLLEGIRCFRHLMLTASLFHRVAAALQGIRYRTLHPVFGVGLAVLQDQTRGISSEDKQQQVPLSTEGLSHVGLYVYKPGSGTSTCIRFEASARSSKLVLYACVYGYRSLTELQNYVLSADAPSDRIGEHSHSPVEMLPNTVFI